MESKTHKTNFWLLPFLGIVCFLSFGCAYAILIPCLTSWCGFLHGSYFRAGGIQLYVSYGDGAGLFVMAIIAIAGVLSAITTMMLLKLVPKAMTAIKKNRVKT
jgi:hypothetical protein